MYDRRNREYYYNEYFYCNNCHKMWGVEMEFNNGRIFIVGDNYGVCPYCGSEDNKLISEDDYKLTLAELEINS